MWEPLCGGSGSEGYPDVEVCAVACVTDRSEAGQEPERRLIRGFGVSAQGVSALGSGVLGGVPGQGGADAVALVGVGDLQPEVEDTRLPADGTGAGERERLIVGVQRDPALRVGQQTAQVTPGEVGASPAAPQIVRGAALMEGFDQCLVRLRDQAGARENGGCQQEQGGSAASSALRRYPLPPAVSGMVQGYTWWKAKSWARRVWMRPSYGPCPPGPGARRRS